MNKLNVVPWPTHKTKAATRKRLKTRLKKLKSANKGGN